MTKEKESGLTKLIELLNEYEKENKSDLYYKFELENGELYCYNDVSDVLWTMQDEAMVICSKKFGFIKWLVENEKIDREQKTKEFRLQIELDNGSYGELGGEARLLMLLAISDTPIKDLISYLK